MITDTTLQPISHPEIPLAAQLRWKILPIRQADGALLIAGADAPDALLVAWLDAHLTEAWRWQHVDSARIDDGLANQTEKYRALGELNLINDATSHSQETGISLNSLVSEENRTVRLVNSTLHDAVADGASDIHFEATPDGCEIKFRIDGLLVPAGSVRAADGRQLSEEVVSRIKVLAELDIAETRIPQDGRFKMSLEKLGSKTIDFRVSVMPSLHGEDVVLRILDKRRLAAEAKHLSLSLLGFSEEQAGILRSLGERPHGMVLVTGPTGSGKTTSLYALLLETARSSEKTISIEDPVEYQLPGILQIPVNEKKGLTFARGLRSILRHDPDRIMVGEIRDPETAEIAVQAALTGHLVLSSVHANGVFEVIQRFTHMDIDLHAVAACLNGVVAQRLVRLNCPHCRRHESVTPNQLQQIGLSQNYESVFRVGTGCAACRGTGRMGRKAIAQCLVLNDALREAIVAQQSLRQLKSLAAEQGTTTWAEAVHTLLIQGDLCFDEIRRALAN